MGAKGHSQAAGLAARLVGAAIFVGLSLGTAAAAKTGDQDVTPVGTDAKASKVARPSGPGGGVVSAAVKTQAGKPPTGGALTYTPQKSDGSAGAKMAPAKKEETKKD